VLWRLRSPLFIFVSAPREFYHTAAHRCFILFEWFTSVWAGDPFYSRTKSAGDHLDSMWLSSEQLNQKAMFSGREWSALNVQIYGKENATDKENEGRKCCL